MDEKEKVGGVDYPTWFKLLKGETSLQQFKLENENSNLRKKIEKLTSVLVSCRNITVNAGHGGRKAIRELINSAL